MLSFEQLPAPQRNPIMTAYGASCVSAIMTMYSCIATSTTLTTAYKWSLHITVWPEMLVVDRSHKAGEEGELTWARLTLIAYSLVIQCSRPKLFFK